MVIYVYLYFAGELQDMRDILQYTSHCDPQLKGNTAILTGNILHSALIESRGNFDSWVKAASQSGIHYIHFNRKDCDKVK